MPTYSELTSIAIAELGSGRCVSIIGLSNTGKSTLLRSLATQEGERLYRGSSGREALLVYVDCNRAIALSAQAFYEVVLRALLDRYGEQVPQGVSACYQTVTEAASDFSASLAFNLALSELCESRREDVCLLLDEFDELYVTLEERALLNLRALHDRFRERLRYATATVRRLPEMRGGEVEGEFAELFAHSTFAVPALSLAEARSLLADMELPAIPAEAQANWYELAGGHPGLLQAVALVLVGQGKRQAPRTRESISQQPGTRVECMKIWNQVTPQEQEGLRTLVVEAEEQLPPRRMLELQELGLVREGRPFSPLFADFIARLHQGAMVGVQGVRMDLDSGDVWVDGVRVPVLTDLEFRLLKLLYERRDKLTDKFRIVNGVWGEEFLAEVDDARVEKLVSRLRSKLEQDPADPVYLITQRGRGYKLLSSPLRSKDRE